MGSVKKEFSFSEEEFIDNTLKLSNLGSLKELKIKKFIDLQPEFNTSHFINGFGHKDKKFHLAAEWKINNKTFNKQFELPDHYDLIEKSSKKYPFKLITAPAHNFLNSSFTETNASKNIEKNPTIKIHSEDMTILDIKNNEIIEIGNNRAKLKIHAEAFDGMLPGVVIVEGGLSIHIVLSSEDICPSGQSVQFSLFSVENLSFGHNIHSAEPSAEYVPAGHFLQSKLVFEFLLEYVPAGHF